MKNASRIVVSALASLALVAAVWALPPATSHVNTLSAQAAQPQSISGKIASVEKDSFTLNVASGPAHQMEQTSNSPKTMTFLIDKNTTVEGKLKVDAMADVTYRSENGQNVAISVRVTP